MIDRAGGPEGRADAPAMAPRPPTLGCAPAKPWRASGAARGVSCHHPLQHRVAVMPGRFVAVHLGARIPDRAEHGEPCAQLDVPRLVELLTRDAGELRAAALSQPVEHAPVPVEIR